MRRDICERRERGVIGSSNWCPRSTTAGWVSVHDGWVTLQRYLDDIACSLCNFVAVDQLNVDEDANFQVRGIGDQRSPVVHCIGGNMDDNLVDHRTLLQ